jgi:Tol biopolymer transport system component
VLAGVGFLCLLLIGPWFTGLASAGGPVKAGSTFITSYLNQPRGSIVGGVGGYGDDSVERAALSQNGRYVAFVATANTLSRAAHPDVANVFRKDQNTGAVALVSRPTGAGTKGLPSSSYEVRISADGNLVAFLTKGALSPTDVDGAFDVYVRNLTTGETVLATPDTAGSVNGYDLSADGQFVAFTSNDVLDGVDAGGRVDVFRRNLGTGVVNLVSRIPASVTAGNGSSREPSISGDGRWVAFASTSTDITAAFIDGNGGFSHDVFVRDMTVGQTFVVSSAFDGVNKGGNGESGEPAIAGTPAASAGVRVSYSSYATNVAIGGVDPDTNSSVYLRSSLAAAPSTLISQSTGGANADSRAHTPRISDDGNLVFFSSDAGNLGAGANYYGAHLRNVSEGTTVLGSADNEYAIAGDVSGDGNMIAWGEAGGITPDSDRDAFGVFTRPIPGGPVLFASRPRGSKPFRMPGAYSATSEAGTRTISADGRYAALTLNSKRLDPGGDAVLIYRRDLLTGKLELASRKNGKNGAKADYASQASISSDGMRISFVAFDPLVAADTDSEGDVYVRDLRTNRTVLASRANGAGGAVADANVASSQLSGDGRRVVFETEATNLGVPGGKAQVYVRDLATNRTILVSRATGVAGAAGNDDSGDGRISNNGLKVVFVSRSSNLNPGDGDAQRDIYVRNLASNNLLLASRQPGLGGVKSGASSFDPAISGDGRVIAFRSEDANLVPASGPWPVFTDQIVSRVLANGVNKLVSRSAGGAVANSPADSPSLNRDGSLIAFSTSADNLLAGRGGESRQAVLVKNIGTGRLSGPPAFGLIDNEPQQGSISPSISDNGRCVAFNAQGHNRISGDFSDIRSSYVYVLQGTCSNPRGTPKPVLSRVSFRPSKFALAGRRKGTKLRFRLNTKATVTITFKRRGKGRKLTAKLVKKNQKAGTRVIKVGRKVGRKKLRPGSYTVTISARNGVGKSKTVRKKVKVRRR